MGWFELVCVCECVTVNTTLWWKKESGQIFTHSTHLLDVLQAEVALANKWICVLLIPLFPLTDNTRRLYNLSQLHDTSNPLQSTVALEPLSFQIILFMEIKQGN